MENFFFAQCLEICLGRCFSKHFSKYRHSRKNIFACLLSVHNIRSLLLHEKYVSLGYVSRDTFPTIRLMGGVYLEMQPLLQFFLIIVSPYLFLLGHSEAAIRRSSYKKLLRKYAANLQENKFIEIALRHGFSPVNLQHVFRIPFPMNTSAGLLLEFDCGNF